MNISIKLNNDCIETIMRNLANIITYDQFELKVGRGHYAQQMNTALQIQEVMVLLQVPCAAGQGLLKKILTGKQP